MKRFFAPWRMEYLANECEDGCIFCKAVLHANPDEKLIISKSEKSFIIMNKYPYANGHVMVVPYKHSGVIEELEDDIFYDLTKNIKKIVIVLKKVLKCEGVNIGANIGKSAGAGVVDHLHFHLVPRWVGDTNFMPIFAECRIISEYVQDTFAKLKKAYQEIEGNR